MEEKPLPGDVIWVKLSSRSWWPAVVVNENAVTESYMPDDNSSGDILVRLYGSYEYMYVDPIKLGSEFKIVLKQNDGSYGEIFRQALEQDLGHAKSSKSRGRGSKSKGASNGKVGAHIDRKLNHNRAKKEGEASDDRSKTPKKFENQKKNKLKTPTSGDARRMKVMQNLALAAPSGSPFHKNGNVNASL